MLFTIYGQISENFAFWPCASSKLEFLEYRLMEHFEGLNNI